MEPTLVVDHTRDSLLLHWLALEKECPLDIVPEHYVTPVSGQLPPPYYADGEVYVYDHYTLVQFLQERYPGITLMPSDPSMRAVVRQACRTVREEGNVHDELHAVLGAQPYVGGDQFSIVDVYVGAWLSDYVLEHEVSKRVSDYWKLISNRPAYKEACNGPRE